MSYHGDIRLGDTIHVKFTTVNTSGVPTTLAGTPVVSAYPADSLTQITAGITLTVDFDALAGLNHVTVVATGANGYATATNYTLVITTGTVGGSSVVGYTVGSFSIENRVLNAAKIDADAISAAKIAAGAITSAKFAAGAIDNAAFNVTETLTANPATGGIVAASFGAGAIDAAAIATDAIGSAEFSQAAADKVWSSATRTLTAFSTALALSVWDVLETAILAASSIGLKVKNNLDAAITSRLAPTVAARTLDVAVGGEAGIDLDNTIGTLAKTTDITGFNDLSAAQVNAEVDAALDTAIPAVNVAGSVNDILLDVVNVRVDAAVSSRSTLTAAQVNAEVDTALDTAIPAANTVDSVNDILLDRVKPNLDVIVSTRATPAQVNAEVVDALNVDTYAMPGQAAPPATASIVGFVGHLYKSWRNKKDNDGAATKLYNDAGTVVDHKQATSEAAGVVTKDKWAAGP